jgi:hypothetical protein
MKHWAWIIVGALVAPVAAVDAAAPALSPADRAAAFRAGGFTLQRGQWRGCDDPGTAGYVPGTIEQVADLNGDGLPEAVITESSSFCFGATEAGYALVSKRKGGWVLVDKGPGMIRFLATRGAGGWPDMEVGGPGFCFPVMRWNGRAYALHRREYEGKPCRG